jgi:hypothetical protein
LHSLSFIDHISTEENENLQLRDRLISAILKDLQFPQNRESSFVKAYLLALAAKRPEHISHQSLENILSFVEEFTETIQEHGLDNTTARIYLDMVDHLLEIEEIPSIQSQALRNSIENDLAGSILREIISGNRPVHLNTQHIELLLQKGILFHNLLHLDNISDFPRPWQLEVDGATISLSHDTMSEIASNFNAKELGITASSFDSAMLQGEENSRQL